MKERQQRRLALARAEAGHEKAEEGLVAARVGARADVGVQELEHARAMSDIEAAERTIDSYTLHAPRDGVLVREVEPGSAADRAGIREGDMIVAAGGRPIVEPDDVYDALGTADANGSLEVRIVRGAEELTLEARFGETGQSDPSASSGPVH